MKTAVSIPDPVFAAADDAARRLGISRSELYARALKRYLQDEPGDEVTVLLDEIYGEVPSNLDPELARAQRRAVSEVW